MDRKAQTPTRQDLYNLCMKAYQETGTVRSPEWKQAKANLIAFDRKHGHSYNPD